MRVYDVSGGGGGANSISEAYDGVPGGDATSGRRTASEEPGKEQQQASVAMGAQSWSCGEQRFPVLRASVQPMVVAASAVTSQRLRPRVMRSLMDMMPADRAGGVPSRQAQRSAIPGADDGRERIRREVFRFACRIFRSPRGCLCEDADGSDCAGDGTRAGVNERAATG
jgi:hypothetical protein